MEEERRTFHSIFRSATDLSEDDLSFERSEDDETEIDWEPSTSEIRKTESFRLPLTFTMPVPWPIRPSEAFIIS